MISINERFGELERLIESAQHNFEETGDQLRVEQYIDSMIVPIAADLLDKIIGRRHALEKSQEWIIHYTNVASLFSMFKNNMMRLYDSDNANDPVEGKFFDGVANLASQYSWLGDPSPMPAYTASFVISDSVLDYAERCDNLVYWRSYGDSGHGCSLGFSAPVSGLKRVLYGADNVEITAQRLTPLLNRMTPYTLLSSPVGSSVSKLLHEAINTLRYLYKPTDYEYEHECRLVVLRQQRKAAQIQFDYRRDHGGTTPVRHYCYDERLRLEEMLKATGSTITIGPAVSSKEALKRTMRIALEKLGTYGAAVTFSQIPYRTG